jgi:hypothetical protein
MSQLALKPNPATYQTTHRGPCALCGHDAAPTGHWDLFLAEGAALVCRDCARKQNPELVAAHRVAVVLASATLLLHRDARAALEQRLVATLDKAEGKSTSRGARCGDVIGPRCSKRSCQLRRSA